MLKKQIQKFSLITALILIFFSIFPILSADAQNEALHCTYSSTSVRGASDIGIGLSDNRDDQNNPNGIKGEIDIRYKQGSPGNDFRNDPNGCNTDTIKGFIRIEYYSVAWFSGPFPTTGSFTAVSRDIPVTINSITPENSSLRLKARFDIKNLQDVISGNYVNTIKDYNGVGTNTYPTYITFITSENGKIVMPSYGGNDFSAYNTARSMYMYGCANQSKICQRNNGGSGTTVDPTATNDLLVKLLDVKLAIRTSVPEDSKQFLPASTKNESRHNFLRTYIDNSGRIVPFKIQSFVIPTAPKDKSLLIGSGGKTTEIVLEQDAANAGLSPKKLISIGSGIYNKKTKFSSATDYGCIKDSYSSNYVYGNKAIGYNLCNFEPKAEATSNVAIKADGGNGLTAALALSDSTMKSLKAAELVKCQDAKTGTGCDETMNVIQVAPFMKVDSSVMDDTSGWAPFLAPFFAPKTIYDIYRTWGGLPLTYQPADFYVQIYPSEAAWKANIDKPIPSSVPAPADIESTAQAQEQSTVQSLYEFIVRIVSSIVILLTSIIYRIFAYFVVPVINALLGVRPYQDAFVNLTFPGWLILRNLANIFFIISLLYVGLNILFQRSNAGIARVFIRNLILMALLVNFSLVITQGIVAIADTAQSQFLPQNSKVIEALGTKLMVEPIQSFRTAVGGGDVAGEIQGDANVGDIVKPIVLLVLAVAAFFSFLAIAAFLAVRIVMLMVLYMTSPMAYVLYVMDETRGYTRQWWSEFIKWAFLTPILVFFLNIAAWVATVTSTTNGDVIKINDTLSGELVQGGITIVSHFIVLVFIYAGMMVATRLGGNAGKTIVKYAQKGFKNSFKPSSWSNIPGMGALGGLKDWGADKAATKASDAGYDKFAKAITAAAKPIEFGKAVKKAQFTDPAKERKEREDKRLSSLAGAKTKGDVLKSYREKMKDFSDMDSAQVRDTLAKKAKEHNKTDSVAAMLQLAKEGNFDDILDAAHQVDPTKNYTKDAAGLNAATRDLQKQLGLSEDETTAIMQNFDKQAKKDKSKSHYAGNTEYSTETGKTTIRELNDDVNRRFKNEPEWVQQQIKNRTDMSLVEDLKQSHLDSMVKETKHDDAPSDYSFTDTQLGVMANTDLGALKNPETINKFKSSANKKLTALRKAWKTGGRAKFEDYLRNIDMDDGDKLDLINGYDKLYSIKPVVKEEKPTAAGFTTTRVVTTGGGVIDPTAPTSLAGQSARMDAAQNINNVMRTQHGGSTGSVIDATGRGGSAGGNALNQPNIGHAETNVEPGAVDENPVKVQGMADRMKNKQGSASEDTGTTVAEPKAQAPKEGRATKTMKKVGEAFDNVKQAASEVKKVVKDSKQVWSEIANGPSSSKPDKAIKKDENETAKPNTSSTPKSGPPTNLPT